MSKQVTLRGAILMVAAMVSGATQANAQQPWVPTPESVSVTDDQAHREQMIADVLRTWSSAAGSADQLASGLRSANDEQLAAALKATSYGEVNRILMGSVTNALGATTGDYVYTAVAPCRIFDTRNPGGGGTMAPGSTRDFFVYGTTDIANQGGNATGCLSPRGEPRAVHINLTAVPVVGPGNLRVYPQNIAPPTVSSVNFVSNNIANALTVQTFFFAGAREIQVLASNSSDVVADVLGYFYEADLTLGSGKTLNGVYTVTSATTALHFGNITFPLRLASAPNGNFRAVGSAATANCPGTAANPTAAAGQLCVYEGGSVANAFFCFFSSQNGCATPAAYGANMAFNATGVGYSIGTWAVTAP